MSAWRQLSWAVTLCFNALTGLSCYSKAGRHRCTECKFQCPHGLELLRRSGYLIRHAVNTCVNALSGLYLISTGWRSLATNQATSTCQCPLGLIPHFYVPLQKPRFYAVSRACFCRYLSEYSDKYRFSCMLTFWTYLMRCTYPWHWIKYSTNYNRCHPIFSLSW